MKKLLSFLVVTILTTSTGVVTIACNKNSVSMKSDNSNQSNNKNSKVEQEKEDQQDEQGIEKEEDNKDKQEIKKAKISAQILENLGLIDEQGLGLKEVILRWDGNKPYFDVDQESIKLTDLLVNQEQKLAKVKDEVSFDFLRALKVELVQGKSFSDGLFKVADVTKIKAKISDLQVETMKFEYDRNENLFIKNGTYNLQFFNTDDSEALSESYQLKTRSGNDALFDIFSQTEGPIKLDYNQFVYKGSTIEKFRLGESAGNVDKWHSEQTIIRVRPESETNQAKKFNEFQWLIGWDITFKINNYYVSRPTLKLNNNLSLDVILTKDDQTIVLAKKIVIRI